MNEAHNTETNAVAPKLKSSAFVVPVVLALLAIVYLIPYWYTSDPKSCTRCHEMEHYYDTWKQSVHSRAAKNCFYCHVKPGRIPLIVYRLSFYREIYASMAGKKLKPLNAQIPAVTGCSRSMCHSLNRMSSISGDIRIDHKRHIKDAKLTCIKCHSGVAHPNGKIVPGRELCFTCHAQRKNDCSMCHTKRVSKTSVNAH